MEELVEGLDREALRRWKTARFGGWRKVKRGASLSESQVREHKKEETGREMRPECSLTMLC